MHVGPSGLLAKSERASRSLRPPFRALAETLSGLIPCRWRTQTCRGPDGRLPSNVDAVSLHVQPVRRASAHSFRPGKRETAMPYSLTSFASGGCVKGWPGRVHACESTRASGSRKERVCSSPRRSREAANSSQDTQRRPHWLQLPDPVCGSYVFVRVLGRQCLESKSLLAVSWQRLRRVIC